MSESNYKNNFFNTIKGWISGNPGTALGILVGLILGILLFTLGIFKTILLLIFMAAGYWLGSNKDKNNSIVDQISKLFKKDE